MVFRMAEKTDWEKEYTALYLEYVKVYGERERLIKLVKVLRKQVLIRFGWICAEAE